ncbi:MAG TPA: hypothetical protein VNK41_04415 [Vicinamibacterales bacterium]|nr:hypothetical protein [Vicinamibacterales bacterium]
MPLVTRTIIAEPRAPAVSLEAAHRRFARTAAVLTMSWGAIAALYYYGRGLTLSHYDARAHLVVARRIIDSLTPGWEQIGAVWLPLPHLLNMLPVQIDALYRTGASGVAISVASMGLAAYAIASMILYATGSRTGAALAVLLVALNPNLLYLQSTPMTEPLLFGLIAYSAWAVLRWADDPVGWRPTAGWALIAACLTRYEAWPFIAAALTFGAVARWQQRRTIAAATGDTARLALYPLLAVIAFVIHSRATVGEWFVTGGFYVPDPGLQGHAIEVVRTIWWTARRLGSFTLMLSAFVAVALSAAVAIGRERYALLVPLALLAVAALPFYAFYEGHPLRTRYMIPLVFGASVSVGLGIGLLAKRARYAAAVVVLAGVLVGVRPFDDRAPMLREAQWDIERTRARQAVTACLTSAREPHDSVLISMGALAHYIQDLSKARLGIRDFLHEGNGVLWTEALAQPSKHVNWMLIDLRARIRDQLKARAQSDPEFLRGFTQVCEAAGVALYRRDAYRPVAAEEARGPASAGPASPQNR